jgi:hypothetical protein
VVVVKEKTPGDPIEERRDRNWRPPPLPRDVDSLEGLRRFLSRSMRKVYWKKMDGKQAAALTGIGSALLKTLQAIENNELASRVADLEEMITKLHKRQDALVTKESK